MINVILCGGAGTRLWPVSKSESPKQFYKFFDGISLFQQTVIRNVPLCSRKIIVTNQAQSELCRIQEGETHEVQKSSTNSSYLIEPVGRNTAPAIALAALSADPDDVLLICPSDHAIADNIAYHAAVSRARILANQGYIVTLGIRPTSAVTGYGYIEAKDENVLSFKEKPDVKTAQSYLSDGRYYWNSGIFCVKAGLYLSELAKYEPEIHSASIATYNKARQKNSCIVINYDDMAAIPAKSIDYAVMEKSRLVKVVPCDCGWSDLGTFDSLYEYFDKDDKGNAHNPQAVYIDSKNNYTLSSSERPVVMVGVEDLIIVDTADALLVAKRGKAQDVRKAFEAIKKITRESE